MEDYIQNTALGDQDKMISKTWCWVYDKKTLLGFITLANYSVDKKILPLEKHGKFPYAAIPSLLVGQLAAHQDYSHNGLGLAMLQFATQIADQLFEKSGCRFIILHPADAAIPWYEKNIKFRIFPRSKRKMVYFDLLKNEIL